MFVSKQLMEDVKCRKLTVNVKDVHHRAGLWDNRYATLQIKLRGPHNRLHARMR